MLSKLVRGVALLFFVAMIAAYAYSPDKGDPAQPQTERKVSRLYS